MALVQQPVAAPQSAAGLLSLLDEEDDALRLFALQSLNRVVHEFWFQIASAIASVEAFYEDESFSHRELAALVASKVFYYLGELDDALTYALGAGQLFDITEKSEYVQTLLARCIDRYIEQRNKPEGDPAGKVDERLLTIVERIFQRCYADGRFEQAVGVALEARRLDQLEAAVQASPDPEALLAYTLRVCHGSVASRSFRQQVLALLVALHRRAPRPDWVAVCTCLAFLGDAQGLADALGGLLRGTREEHVLAYQIAFDLFETEDHQMLAEVERLLQPPKSEAAPVSESKGDGQEADGSAPAGAAAAAEESAPAEASSAGSADTDMAALDGVGEDNGVARLCGILSGTLPIHLHLFFLHSRNRVDMQVLASLKGAVEQRNSVCHSAVVFANAAAHAGTTVDAFLRQNLDWLARATNWAKFSATAGLGVIHRGHVAQGRALMGPYLPREGAAGSPYSEGGALYALGLIHANHASGREPAVRDFLLQSLRNATQEPAQHGACLGLGLALLGTGDEEAFEDLKNTLYSDNAVAGEAAGLALGLVCAGTGAPQAADLLAYAHDTQHEKIIRGIALGLAFVQYGREEEARPLIEQLTREQDPILRYGGMFVLGLAFRGTSNNWALQKLLHFAVSDVSHDVRRAAVLCIGFVLLNSPARCPEVVALLAASYNPHTRYGAALAVGIACGGTGCRAAVDLLAGLLEDATDIVRQGALVAMALVQMQQPEAQVKEFRARLLRMAGDKHEEVMARMGAIMAAGILDAGGRNVAPATRAPSGFFRRTAILGLALFAHHWYWHPLAYCLSLTLHPTFFLGIDSELRFPKVEVVCACSPATYAYPEPLTGDTGAQAAKLPTAVLSTTARAASRARTKKLKGAQSGLEADGVRGKADGAKAEEAGPSSKQQEAAAADTEMKDSDQEHEQKAGAKPAGERAAAGPSGADDMEVEAAAPAASAEGLERGSGAARGAKGGGAGPSSHLLGNTSRVTPAQAALVRFQGQGRWQPLQRGRIPSGTVLLHDTAPGTPAEFLEMNGHVPAAGSAPAQQQPTDQPARGGAQATPAAAPASGAPSTQGGAGGPPVAPSSGAAQ